MTCVYNVQWCSAIDFVHFGKSRKCQVDTCIIRHTRSSLADDAHDLSGTVGQKDPEELKEDFEQLMNMIVPERGIPKEDLAKIKKQCFPQTSFWVTETRTGDELTQEGGVLVSFLHVISIAFAIISDVLMIQWILCPRCVEVVCIIEGRPLVHISQDLG